MSVSSQSLVAALQRLQAVRELGIALPAARVPPSRLASLARFAGAAKVSAMGRLPPARRIATLVAFVHCLEATAQDDALEVLERLLRALFAEAAKADRQARLRTLKDLDQAAILLAAACRLLLDPVVVDVELRPQVFARVPQNTLTQALDNVDALTRPPDDVFYGELEKRYGKVRRFLPTLLKQVHSVPVRPGNRWWPPSTGCARTTENPSPTRLRHARWSASRGSARCCATTGRSIAVPIPSVCSTRCTRPCAAAMCSSRRVGGSFRVGEKSNDPSKPAARDGVDEGRAPVRTNICHTG